jgi:hypothetical protein
MGLQLGFGLKSNCGQMPILNFDFWLSANFGFNVFFFFKTLWEIAFVETKLPYN